MSSSAAHPDGAWTYDVLDAQAVDGDTARIQVDQGFGVRFQFDVRLEGINAPELHDPGGQEAKQALQALIINRPLIATTYRTATGGEIRSFARWVGTLKLWPDTAQELDVGVEMVNSGHARYLVLK